MVRNSSPKKSAHAEAKRSVRNILLVGRFFAGVQCKGHLSAIAAFKLLKKQNPSIRHELKLTLLGHVATGQEAYHSDVKRRAAKVDGVRVLTNVQPKVMHSEIASSDVVWSLTGLDRPQVLLPADAEHFGLALL